MHTREFVASLLATANQATAFNEAIKKHLKNPHLLFIFTSIPIFALQFNNLLLQL